jgi:hypothetical protein
MEDDDKIRKIIDNKDQELGEIGEVAEQSPKRSGVIPQQLLQPENNLMTQSTV